MPGRCATARQCVPDLARKLVTASSRGDARWASDQPEIARLADLDPNDLVRLVAPTHLSSCGLLFSPPADPPPQSWVLSPGRAVPPPPDDPLPPLLLCPPSPPATLPPVPPLTSPLLPRNQTPPLDSPLPPPTPPPLPPPLDRARRGGSGALSPAIRSSRAEFPFEGLRLSGPVRRTEASMAGSHAVSAREPGQIREEAALSDTARAPWASLAGAEDRRARPRSSSRDGCTVHSDR